MKIYNFLLTLLLCILCLFSCGSKDKSFNIKGTLAGNIENGRVYLYKANHKSEIVDSAQIHNNMFELKGEVSIPELHKIVIDLNKPGNESKKNLLTSYFYVENSEIIFTADVTSMSASPLNIGQKTEPEIKGSKTNDLYRKFVNLIKDIEEERIDAHNRYSKEYIIPQMNSQDVTDRGIELVSEMAELTTKYDELVYTFIKNNASSAVSLDVLLAELSSPKAFTTEQLDEILSWFEKPWKNTEQLIDLQNKISKRKKVAIGEKYFDGTFLTTEGDSIKLSSLVKENGYTLLEFWASWCGPCRGEIPHLKDIHKKYPDFNIISISVDDKEKDWYKALAEEQMAWKQLRSSVGFSGIIKDEYNISGVPTCIVVDKQGRYFKTRMRGAYLDKFLLETYGY